ncbi:MAG: hypothetical protein JNL70_10940 [Saprospiraceae bacterium]|nr:hypothetical protein [Saprospiraceae bacterium]
MFYSLFLKHTFRNMLFALFFTLSSYATAQIPKANFFAPVSIGFSWLKKDTTQSMSEFSNTETTDILPQLGEQPALSNDIVAETALVGSDTVKNDNLAESATSDWTIQDSTCVDLQFDSVSVVKMTEKYVEIEYSIINKGTAPAPIFGTKRSNMDNVAIHFYFSGTPRLTRGSILAEGIYLTEGLRSTKGLLAPNAVYKGVFRLPLEKKNRFYGVIILQLDALDVMRHECDETNNIFAIVPKWY